MQYKQGLVSTSTGSPTVTGVDTFWLSNVRVGDEFIVPNHPTVYTIAGLISDEEIQLSVPFAGPTLTDSTYTVQRDFTASGLALLNQGDVETAVVYTRTMRRIQSLFNGLEGLNYVGEWEAFEFYSPGTIVVFDDNGAIGLYIASQEHESSVGNAPPDTDYWNVIITSGDVNSIVFTSLSWVGDWEPTTEYFEQNVVRFEESIYVCITNHTSPAEFDEQYFEYLINLDELFQYKEDAEQAATTATLAANAASLSEMNAGASETNAGLSADAALLSEQNSATSEQNASDSETNAGLSATAAFLSAENAALSEQNSATSEQNASDSETNAGLSATAAFLSAENAALSEQNSATSEQNASDSETAAEAAADIAVIARDKAEEWADNPLGDEVEPGKYSARHWAEQLGAVPNTAYNWRDEWEVGEYVAGDAVFHVPTGSSYITLVTTTDEPSLTLTTDWQLLAEGATLSGAPFSGLVDTPSDYVGQGLKLLTVTLAEDGIGFRSLSDDDLTGLTVVTSLTTSYDGVSVTITPDVGAAVVLNQATDTLAGIMSASDFSKLSLIEAGATQNQDDSYLLDRVNHTGTQTLATISDAGVLAASDDALGVPYDPTGTSYTGTDVASVLGEVDTKIGDVESVLAAINGV